MDRRDNQSLSLATFFPLLATALAARVALLATSFGTTDAFLLMVWTKTAERFGVGAAYHHAQYLNHPPLALLLLILADRLADAFGVAFPVFFRILQTAADCVTAAMVYLLARRFHPRRSREYAAFFFASPAAIFLSGFHCNSDPTMIALLAAAVLLSSGVLLGIAGSVKIAPIPLAPFFLISMPWRRRLAFAGVFFAALAFTYLPAARSEGLTMFRNIFAYGGSGYEWGFCGLGYVLLGKAWAMFYARIGRYAVIAALAVLFFLFVRRPRPLAAMIGVALLAMNFFSPAFGVQYLVWPLAFLPFALPRPLAYAANATLSIFLFATYTIWARGFPWWFADAAAPNPLRPLVALLAIPLWLLYGWAIVAALRHQPGEIASQELPEARAGD